MTVFDLRPFATSLASGATLSALVHAGLSRNPECAHEEYISRDDPDAEHRAGFTCSPAIALASVRVRFRPGWAPKRWQIEALTDDGETRRFRSERGADALEHEVALGGASVVSLCVVMPPGGGSEAHPGVLRVAALALVPAWEPDARLTIERPRGRRETPASPAGLRSTGAYAIDAGDAVALEVEWATPRTIEGLLFEVYRAGASADPARFAASLEVTVDGEAVEAEPVAECGEEGAFAGVRALGFRLTTPRDATRVRVTLPPRPWPMYLATSPRVATRPLSMNGEGASPADRWQTTCPRGRSPSPSMERGRAAARGEVAPRHAASLGLPCTDPRVGVSTDGTWLVQLDGVHDRHLAVSTGVAVFEREVIGRGAGLVQWARIDGALVRHTLVVEGEPSPCLHARVETDGAALPVIALAVRGGGLPWASELRARGPRVVARDGRTLVVSDQDFTVESGAHETRLRFRDTRAVTLRVPLDDAFVRARALEELLAEATAQFDSARRGVLDFQLPEESSQALVSTLLDRAALFALAGERHPYGLFPSVYAGDVFGLEEDYLFRALAEWGLTERALAALRATYLTDEHLDKRHYLHDLRNGLTPWQTARLLALAGQSFGDLARDERGRLTACGEWVTASRARTRDATGARDANGARVFPGLLPPFRFGGDLSFPTQSLYTDVANCVALRELGAMTGEARFGAEARAYRAAIERAFDAVREGDFHPVHTGGGDPGEYYELMVCGILDPIDFFAPDDPRRFAFDVCVERRGRLFRGLPRFDEWGTGRGLDAHYALGYAKNLLFRGLRDPFVDLLGALTGVAMDQDVHTFREVGPILDAPVDWPEPFVPGRRLAQAEPCIGGVGVALSLTRHALVTETPDDDGRSGPRLRVLAGIPPEWYDATLAIERAPSLAGPVSLHLEQGRLRVEAPGAESVEVVTRDGSILTHTGGAFTERVA